MSNDKEKYSVEEIVQIWDNKTGERIEFGPDRDGLDLVEIRQYSDDSKVGARIVLTKEQIVLLAENITSKYGRG